MCWCSTERVSISPTVLCSWVACKWIRINLRGYFSVQSTAASNGLKFSASHDFLPPGSSALRRLHYFFPLNRYRTPSGGASHRVLERTVLLRTYDSFHHFLHAVSATKPRKLMVNAASEPANYYQGQDQCTGNRLSTLHVFQRCSFIQFPSTEHVSESPSSSCVNISLFAWTERCI